MGRILFRLNSKTRLLTMSMSKTAVYCCLRVSKVNSRLLFVPFVDFIIITFEEYMRIMENLEGLPILLVSAKDKDAATTIISEIIQDKSEENEADQKDKNYMNCLWKIINKYYTANVCVHALLDGENLPEDLVDSIEAHVIYITEDECAEESVVETMQRRASAGSAAEVRLVAAEAHADPPALGAACARARLELVPLREPAPEPDERDERGAARVRAALHAHLWPGHHRQSHSLDSRAALCEESCGSDDGIEEGDEEWSEWCSGPARAGSEEAFFAALASLPGAAAAARSAGGREERLARAEQLLQAFCHALGTPLD